MKKMKKVNELSREELEVARFIYVNREKEEAYKSYFINQDRFAVLSRLKRDGFITFLKLGNNGDVERILLSNDIINYLKNNY